jgi:hypothetical protein
MFLATDNFGAQGPMLEFQQRHDGPLVVADQAQNFDNRRVSLAERRAASIVLPAIT